MKFDRKANARERMKFIDFWAEYVRTHADRDWSGQQKVLIDSLIKNARASGMTPEEYLAIKRS